MKHYMIVIILILCAACLCGCSDIQADSGAIMQQVETIASQIDIENLVNEFISKINWEELKSYARDGYDALTEKYPTLKGESIKGFLKENGLELMNNYLQSTDESKQENARKLGEIIKILNPELTDEVDAIIGK